MSHAPSIHRAADVIGLDLDPAQRAAATRLESLASELGRRGRAHTARGVYLWGPVGRGKTWLLDAFFSAAPLRAKRRVHFHGLFRDLHAAVHRNRRAGHAFDAAVAELLDGCDLLCFDELHLHDAGDAMLLTRLLRAAFGAGTVLVATSNYPPGHLLPNPLHHHLFRPGIDLLLSRMEVVEVNGPVDYRSTGGPGRQGFRSGGFVRAADLSRAGLSWPDPEERAPVRVDRHHVRALATRGDLAWFDFRDLCDSPVSALDMLAVAERYTALVVSGVPPLAGCAPDVRQRFVNLVDVLYDRDVALTLVSDHPPAVLLTGDRLAPDWLRTTSRLSELARSSSGA